MKEEKWEDLDMKVLEDAEENLSKMTDKTWRQNALYIEKWGPVFKQTKAVIEPYSQGISK